MNLLIVALLRHHTTASAIKAVMAGGGVELLIAPMLKEIFLLTNEGQTIKVPQGENRPRIKGRVSEIHLRNIVIV